MRTLLLSLALLLAACGSDDAAVTSDGQETPTAAASVSADAEALVGLWQLTGQYGTWEDAAMESINGVSTWTFRPDGSGMSYKGGFENSDMELTDDYTWSLDGSTLSLTPSYGSAKIYEGVEFDGDTVTWFDPDRERYMVLERGGE